MADKSLVRRVHDATCPGAVANIKPVQKICPVCRSARDSFNWTLPRAGGTPPASPTDVSVERDLGQQLPVGQQHAHPLDDRGERLVRVGDGQPRQLTETAVEVHQLRPAA